MKAIIMLLMLLCLPIGGRAGVMFVGADENNNGGVYYPTDYNVIIDTVCRYGWCLWEDTINDVRCITQQYPQLAWYNYRYFSRRWCLPEERPTTRRNNYIWGDTLWIHFSNGDSIMNR